MQSAAKKGDVYKRQEVGHCVNCRPTCAITTGFSGAGAFSDGKLSPVSYTHLDVYKRQGIHRLCHQHLQPAYGYRHTGVLGAENEFGLVGVIDLSLIHI